MNIDVIMKDCDSGKYDSATLFTKTNGLPFQIKWHGVFGSEDEQLIRDAIKSGKYASAIFYKDYRRKLDINLNAKNSCRNAVVANALTWKRDVACNADVVPEIKAEYDRYLKAKAKFDKWWNPNRRFSESGKETRELNDAEKALWTKWRQAFGKPIPSGWAMHPELLKVAPNGVCNSELPAESREINRLYDEWAKEDEKAEGSMSARRALAKYKDYESQLKREGCTIKFGGLGKGIVVSKNAVVNAALEWKAKNAGDGKFPHKYRAGEKGYLISFGRPYEYNGEKVIFTIKEVHDNKDDSVSKKETTYWITSPKHGGMSVGESKFLPISNTESMSQNSVSEMHDEMRRIYLDRAATAGKMGDLQAAEDWRRKAWEIERDE